MLTPPHLNVPPQGRVILKLKKISQKENKSLIANKALSIVADV